MDTRKVGEQIAVLRKSKGLTQSELGERIGVSFQAVSKWERGESLPDVTLLPDLAKILETTVDFILLGGEKVMEYKGKCTVSDLIKGLNSLKKAGEYLGTENLIYRAAIKGINQERRFAYFFASASCFSPIFFPMIIPAAFPTPIKNTQVS